MRFPTLVALSYVALWLGLFFGPGLLEREFPPGNPVTSTRPDEVDVPPGFNPMSKGPCGLIFDPPPGGGERCADPCWRFNPNACRCTPVPGCGPGVNAALNE